MDFKITVLLLLLAVTFAAKAQTEVNNDFKFNDGVYMSFGEFAANTPTYTFDELRIRETSDSNYDKILIYDMKVKNDKGNWVKVKFREVWGLCFEGKPYINYWGGMFEVGANFSRKRMLHKGVRKVEVAFVRLNIVGAICHFTLEGGHEEGGLTGSMAIPTTNGYVRQKILNFKTGEVLPYNSENLFRFMKDDGELAMQFYNEEKRDQKQKLFFYLKEYNERNPFVIE